MNVNSEAPEAFDEIQERWISCHLYYHYDLDQVLRGFVHPAVIYLIKAARIEAFFFVRYGLGGPHVRLRLRVLPGFRDQVSEEIRRFAQNFIDMTPSTKSLEEEVIRRRNESILIHDPHEIDNSIYPDNSFRMIPFRPEVQRYGGPSLFRASLDFFTLSSVAAVEFFSKYGGMSRSAQLAQAFRLLLQQSLGFAVDETELFDLLRYGVNSLGGGRPRVIEKGDKVAGSQMDAFIKLFRQSLAEARSSLQAESEFFCGALDFLVAGASRLSTAIGTTDHSIRTRVGSSQLHMTATRLGLSNAEEVYVSRLLTVTLRELLAARGEDLSWLREKVTEGVDGDPGEALGNLLSPALEVLAKVPMSSRVLQPSS